MREPGRLWHGPFTVLHWGDNEVISHSLWSTFTFNLTCWDWSLNHQVGKSILRPQGPLSRQLFEQGNTPLHQEEMRGCPKVCGVKGLKNFARTTLGSHFLLHSPVYTNTKWKIIWKSPCILRLRVGVEEEGQLALMTPKGKESPANNKGPQI